MFCEECGMEIPEGASVCPTCGAAVARPVRPARPERPEMPERPVRPERPETRPQRQAPRGGAPRGEAPRGAAPRGNAPRGERANRVEMEPPRPARPERPVQQSRPMSGNPMLDGLVLADGETIVKQYLCARYNSWRVSATGRLSVTNKRMIFHATGGDSRINEEVSLDSISGIRGYYGSYIDLKRIIIGAIVILLGIIMAVSLGRTLYYAAQYGGGGGGAGVWLLFLLMAAIGGLLIYSAFGKIYGLIIYAKDVSPSPIRIGGGPKSVLGNSAIYGYSGDQRNSATDQMLNELGALVQDLQSMGDLAIEKWQSATGYDDFPSL